MGGIPVALGDLGDPGDGFLFCFDTVHMADKPRFLDVDLRLSSPLHRVILGWFLQRNASSLVEVGVTFGFGVNRKKSFGNLCRRGGQLDSSCVFFESLTDACPLKGWILLYAIGISPVYEACLIQQLPWILRFQRWEKM